VHAGTAALVILVPELWVALPAMFVGGMAWISVANALAVSAQAALPDWVRARGMSLYQVSLMGGAAAGSLLWGQVAALTSVPAAVLVASASACIVWTLTRRISVEGGPDLDFSPAPIGAITPPAVEVGGDEGPVMVTVEYQIDPARAADFARVMERTRRARLRQGALSWGLFRDVSQPGRYVEYFVDEDWLEHQRRLERFTAFDAGLRNQRLAFHTGSDAPVVRRYVADRLAAGPDLPL
jgi:quinol monooxygenase YgiN/branched-subunit amino acid transport protein